MMINRLLGQRRLMAFLLVLAGFFLARDCAIAVPLPLHVAGNSLVNSRGEKVVLKGVDIPSLETLNLGEGPVPGGILASVHEAIYKWHVSLIRLPICQDRWEGKAPVDYDGNSDDVALYRRLVDRVVASASQAGVYVLIDMHWSDMDVWGANIGQHDMPDDNTAAAWRDIAAHFANNPAVLFDAYNEPHDVPWNVWRNGGSVSEGGATYHTPGMQGIVDTIRSAGAKNVIAVGGLGFAYDISGVTKGYAISGPNIVYSTHIYPPQPSDWDKTIAPVGKVAPILVGEFGADPSSPYAEFMPRILAWIKQHHYNACAWSMNPSYSPCLITNWNYDLSYWEGTYVYSWLNNGPTAPADLKTSGGSGSISLSWSPVAGAKSYDIYRSALPDQVAKSAPIATSVTGTSYADAGLANGATYFYQVAAVNDVCRSGPSVEMGSKVGTPGGFPPPLPTFRFSASPASMTVAVNTPLTITVTATNTSKVDAPASLVDIEIHSVENGQEKQLYAHQETADYAAGQSRTYTITWTPTAPGTDKLEVGAFGGSWSPKYNWDSNVGAINVTP